MNELKLATQVVFDLVEGYVDAATVSAPPSPTSDTRVTARSTIWADRSGALRCGFRDDVRPVRRGVVTPTMGT